MLITNDSNGFGDSAVVLPLRLPWVLPTAGIPSPLCGSKWLPCNNYTLSIMHYALEEAHGWDPITALRF